MKKNTVVTLLPTQRGKHAMSKPIMRLRAPDEKWVAFSDIQGSMTVDVET
jgi:hypothetical protein